MLTRKVSVHRRARTTPRLLDNTRPHGRRSAYAHSRANDPTYEARRQGIPLGACLILGSVFAFLLLIVSGGLAPQNRSAEQTRAGERRAHQVNVSAAAEAEQLSPAGRSQ